VYDTANSGLPSNVVSSLAVDAQGDMWIGTWEGLAVYREGGVILPGTATAVLEEQDQTAVPTVCSLAQKNPNPFNSSTAIRFALPFSGHVELAVYNPAGQQVVTLVDGMRPAASYTVHWDGRDEAGNPLASGVYLARLTISSATMSRKLLLVR